MNKIEAANILYINPELTKRMIATSETTATSEKQLISWTNVPGEFPTAIYTWVVIQADAPLSPAHIAFWMDDSKTAPTGAGRNRAVI